MFSFHDLDLFLYRQSCRISSKFESFLRASNALGRISSGDSFIDVRLRKFAELIEYGNVMRVRVSHFLSRFFGLFPTQGVNCVIALEWRGWFCRGGGSRQGVVELEASLLAYGGKSEPFLLFLFCVFFHQPSSAFTLSIPGVAPIPSSFTDFSPPCPTKSFRHSLLPTHAD